MSNTWAELDPDPGILQALDHADSSSPAVPTANSKGSTPPNQDDKRLWSSSFANGCAIAIAGGLRDHKTLGEKFAILPLSLEKGTEPLTPLGSSNKKRIDVTVVHPLLGLEIGVSLKGMNFRDGRSNNFDKNVTGRIYELSDEMRLVHEHLPHAFMVAVFFLPIEATEDKTRSSFAHTVLKLRARTGRIDPTSAVHASKSDMAFVALYSNGRESDYAKGVTRFFDIRENPPKFGRPQVATTLSMKGMIDRIVSGAQDDSSDTNTEWSEPEPD